ncbi:MAG: hypothetical protein INR69_22395, partial [Mucilaginibacter polytrichastri]|nr:hypothetical protein [Mucilaginibacter polytrichastri]
FDAHPDRIVFQRRNVSGIKFFLWDSQFGRFFNSGPIVRTKGSIFFFVHTLLWAFAPWCLLFFFSVVRNLSWLIRRIRFNEYYTFTGGMLLLLLFSLSGFQLPFYTNILFPFFAIITASAITARLRKAAVRFVNISLGVYAGAFITLLLVLQVFFGVERLGYFVVLMLALMVSGVFVFRANISLRAKFLSFCCVVMVVVHAFSFTTIYPILLQYKGEIAAANYVNTTGNNTTVYTLSMRRNMFQFYCDREIELCSHECFGRKNGDKKAWYFADEEAMEMLNNQKTPYRVVHMFRNYASEVIRFKFLFPGTRNETLSNLYLIAPVE